MIRWSLLLLVVVVLSSTIAITEAAKKEGKTCLEEDITRGKELKKHVMEHHVLVSLQEESSDNDNEDDDDENEEGEEETTTKEKDEYKELCERLQNTPLDRVKDFEIVTVKDASFRKKVLAKAIPPSPPFNLINQVKGFFLGINNDKEKDDNNKQPPSPNYPEYVLFQKGNFDTAIRYIDDANNKSADSISEFVAQQLQRKKIGNFVYSLGTFDLISSQFIKSMKENSASAAATTNTEDTLQTTTTTKDIHYWKAMGWAYMGKIMALIQQYRPDKVVGMNKQREDYIESDKLANTYVKTMFAILEKGIDYPTKQIERLSAMIENDSDNLSDMKIEQIQQRMYTLQKYVEPPVISDEQVRNFIIYSAVNTALWIAIMIMIPLLWFASDDYEEEYYEDEEYEEEGEEDEKKQQQKLVKEVENEEANGNTKDENGEEKKKEE